VSTTNLFVELIVIGTGAVTWLSLLVLSILGYQWIAEWDFKNILALPALIPVVGFMYVLGMVIDRIADRLFEGYTKRICNLCYTEQEPPFYVDRRIVLSDNKPSAALLLYGRSRARICRGWALNSALIVIFLNVFLTSRVYDRPLFWQLTVCGNLVFITLSYGCVFAWKALKKSEYIKTKEQAAFLRGEGKRDQPLTKDKEDKKHCPTT
jgi:hypothetical protein